MGDWQLQQCFYSHDKALVKSSVQFHHEHWKRRCVVLHNPEVQRKVLKEEVLAIMEEIEKYVVKGLSRHVQIHKLKVNEVSTEELLSWVRSARVFEKRSGENKS